MEIMELDLWGSPSERRAMAASTSREALKAERRQGFYSRCTEGEARVSGESLREVAAFHRACAARIYDGEAT